MWSTMNLSIDHAGSEAPRSQDPTRKKIVARQISIETDMTDFSSSDDTFRTGTHFTSTNKRQRQELPDEIMSIPRDDVSDVPQTIYRKTNFRDLRPLAIDTGFELVHHVEDEDDEMAQMEVPQAPRNSMRQNQHFFDSPRAVGGRRFSSEFEY